jgi:hypothetical protein
LQTVLSTLLVCAEQTPAPEQVPASVHCVEGQVTPTQGSGKGPAQHAAHAAAAQPSVHSRAQEPSPQQSCGAGDAHAREINAPSASSTRAILAPGLSILVGLRSLMRGLQRIFGGALALSRFARVRKALSLTALGNAVDQPWWNGKKEKRLRGNQRRPQTSPIQRAFEHTHPQAADAMIRAPRVITAPEKFEIAELHPHLHPCPQYRPNVSPPTTQTAVCDPSADSSF